MLASEYLPRRMDLPTVCPCCGRSSEWYWTPALYWECCPTDGLIEVISRLHPSVPLASVRPSRSKGPAPLQRRLGKISASFN